MKRPATISERTCPACGGQTGLDQGQKNSFLLLSCTTCSTLYTAQSTEGGHRQDYDDYYTSTNLTIPSFIDKRLDEIVATFETYRQNNRLLDIGCGAGSFLQAAARDNWEAFGLEVSQSAIQHVRSLGFEVFHGELNQADYPDGYFDVVVASEILEHLPNPRGLLRSISRILRPGGLFWATTPHGRGISARILGVRWTTVSPPEHLQLFSVPGIKALLSSAGFSHMNVATHGTNPFEIVHAMRHKASRPTENGSEPPTNFNRVESSYQLNEFLSEKPLRRIVKATLNGLLNAGRIGDSLKIRAER
ncbi:MAG TPA: class I SAM-dependent methyltransferase [Pyrinomonadaceae bacterium]